MAVQERTGPVVGIRSADIGLTSGVAAHITTARAVFFVKAAPAAAPVAGHLLRERTTNQVLPTEIPAPRLLWADDVAGWHLLVFEHAPGREADLAPDSPHISAVVDAVAAISVPCPWPDAPSITGKVTALLRQAEAILAECPAEYARYGPLVKAFDLEELAGEALLHADLHSGNLLVDGERCQVVDWSMACRGVPWVDVAFLVPRLIDAGHTPAEAEDVAARVPDWSSAPRDAVTALAATRALFATRMADIGPAHLKEKRLRTSAACRAWAEYRIG
ncbi:phosphotransferase family protein [Streptosporangium sp. NPDC002721]|uniref:phosphotransferase family protein n=1 Tax=Streptosporangium sp. NPDC002721 TaxID=3366188 RepID=UPI003697EC7F